MAKCCSLMFTTALLFIIRCQLCQSGKISADIEAARLRNALKPNHPQTRGLQDFNFRANYTAQFQVLQDSLCLGPAPVIRVYCSSPNIEVLGTSDPSIVCNATAVLDGASGWSYLECATICTSDATCENVYLTDGAIEDGPFGEIAFQCAGAVSYNVNAAVSFEDSGNGTCAPSNQLTTRNFHVLRLGVSCPTGSGADRAYSFDDAYFECNSLGSFVYAPDASAGNQYTCLSGDNCLGKQCDVDFSNFLIQADVPNFLHTCVESLVPITPAPTPAPLNLTEPQLFLFSARFEAAWGLLFDPVSRLACSGTTPTVRMTCRNGDIKFLNSTHETVRCTDVSRGVMECTDSSSANFVDQFTGVVYMCFGPVLPETEIEYFEDVAFCDGNSGLATVRHAVQLGVICDSAEGEFSFFGDLFFDCVDPSSQFELLDEFGTTDGIPRYTCSETATFPSGSTANQTQTISSLYSSTDLYWAGSPDASCYVFDRTDATNSSIPVSPISSQTRAPATFAPTSSPAQAPKTSFPTISPTLGSVVISTPPPATAITFEPTLHPTQSPRGAPQRAPSAPSPTITSSPSSDPKTPQYVPNSEITRSSSGGGGSAIGAAVGGAVGGIVIVGIVVFLVLRRKSGSMSGSVQEYKDQGVGPSFSAADNDHSPTETETGHHAETGYPHQSDDATQPFTQEQESVVISSNSATASQASALDSSPGSSPRYSRQQPLGSVQYKDQVRSVVEPLAVVIPLGNDSLNPYQNPAQATAVAQVMGTSALSALTGDSSGSDPRRRRAIDP